VLLSKTKIKKIQEKQKMQRSSSSTKQQQQQTHTTLPEIKAPHGITSKELLQDSRRGQGRALKFLRQMLDERPDIRKKFLKEQQAEEENMKQRDKLQWAKIQNSKVHSVQDSLVKRNTVFTNPMSLPNGYLPTRPGVDEAAELEKEQQKRNMKLAIKRQAMMRDLQTADLW
jgi:hypothetical protein